MNLFEDMARLEAVNYWVERAKKFRFLMELNHAADTKLLRRPSRLQLDWNGKESYTSKQDYVVHIGVYGIVDRNLEWIHSDEDLLNELEFVRHHEVLHLFYTGGDSYAWGIKKGAEEVMQHIAKEMTGHPVSFRKESDVIRYRRQLQEEFGGVDIVALIEQISANICNCLEDGRIERIGSSEPGQTKVNPPFRGQQFALERTVNRGRNFYEYSNETFEPWEAVKDDPANHLRIIINQILMLSKAQLYQKGFVSAYGDTPLMEEMLRISDHIRTGYLASNTRKMVEGNFGICRELAPLIFEAAKASAENISFAQALMQLLQQLIEQMSDEHEPANSDGDANDDADGAENTALPSNDLMKKPSGKSQNGDGESKDGNDGTDEKDGENNGKGGSSKDGEDADGNDSKDGKSSKKSGTENQNDGEEAKDDGDGSDQSGNGEDASGENSKQNSSGKNKADVSGEADLDAIEQAMKQAAERLNASNSDAVDNINKAAQATAKQNREDAKRVNHKTKPVTPEDVKDLCPRFKELRRKYKVSEQLPPVKLQDGRTFRRWFEKFLKSKKAPTVRFRRSGKLDKNALGALARKDTRVFMKDSKSALRKCCVYILIDNSGSMSGNKRRLACESAGVIEEGIKYTVPTKIVAFDEWGEIVHEVVKDWDEVFVENCCWSFALHGRDGCGNEDGYDIDIATREILARPEERKILIVLSDGAPGDKAHVRRAVENARKQGVKVTGIYFEEGDIVRYSSDFVWMYQRDYVCCTADKIQENLTRIMETFLKG